MDDEEDDHDVPSCESEEEQNSQKEKIIRKVKVNGSNGQMKKWRC